MTSPPRYLALIGDLVSSRDLDDDERAALQRRFLEVVDGLTDELALEAHGALAAAPAVTAGDEFEVLFHEPWAGLDPKRPADRERAVRRGWAFVDVIRRVTEELHPTSIVFGAGFGPLSTEREPDPAQANVAHLDGPCLHDARAAVESAEGRWVVLSTELEGHATLVINGLFDLMNAIRRGWTAKQLEYVRAGRGERRGNTPKRRVLREVAKEFSVSPSVVTESLQAAHFEAIQNGEASVACALVDGTRPGPGEPRS